MDAQHRSGLTTEAGSLISHVMEAGRLGGEADAMRDAAAQGQERERRRIEFRRSLNQARNQARASLAQVAAEVREPRRMRMMAELAQA